MAWSWQGRAIAGLRQVRKSMTSALAAPLMSL